MNRAETRREVTPRAAAPNSDPVAVNPKFIGMCRHVTQGIEGILYATYGLHPLTRLHAVVCHDSDHPALLQILTIFHELRWGTAIPTPAKEKQHRRDGGLRSPLRTEYPDLQIITVHAFIDVIRVTPNLPMIGLRPISMEGIEKEREREKEALDW